MNKRQVYFDNASTTPLDRCVLRAMKPYFTNHFANSSNLYEAGRLARKAIERASEQIATALHCRGDEILFTGSATEADNLALVGTARAHKGSGNRIIISSIEHKGIISACTTLEKEGFEIVKIPVGKDGRVDLDEIKKSLNDKTIIVSVTMADSETGTLQPILEISGLIKDFRAKKHTNKQLPHFHTDASQAAAYADVNVEKLGVDLMTLSAHKLRGPKGIGALYVRHGLKLNPIIYGGGQQGKLRSGTENVPAIVGFGEAVELNEDYKKKGVAHTKKLRDILQKGIFKSVKKVVLNGHPTKRLPNFLNISILDVEGESLLLELDEHGIMVNTGSACNSESLEPSYVLTALGNSYEFIHGSLRFALGTDTTMSDVKYVLKYLPKIVERLRKISPLNLSLQENQEKGGNKKISNPRAFIGNQTPHFLQKKNYEKK
jgi:cysteine desulfurase